MIKAGISGRDSRVLVLGLAFKENCPDIRNTRVVDLVRELRSFGISVDVHDPWADRAQAEAEYGLRLVERPEKAAYDAIVVAVAHECFREAGAVALRRYGRQPCVLFDVKCALPAGASDGRL
jgi:UDP-N-acetyl-D-galactosamine dehydrogenase